MSEGVRITRTVPAPREEVFRAWTDPERLKEWFGPGEFTIPEADLDVRPGGEYLIVMEAPDGNRLRLKGAYREIEPPERLVFTWSWGLMWDGAQDSLVTVEFHTAGDATEVVLTHGDFETAEELAPYGSGWESGLDKLGRVFA
jgi:uncharacterized protein YndB with AHSA1/START domain